MMHYFFRESFPINLENLLIDQKQSATRNRTVIPTNGNSYYSYWSLPRVGPLRPVTRKI